MQEYNINNPTEEYDLSMLEELDNKEFNLQDTLKELFFYLLPIASFVFFMFILFGAVIPTINETGAKLNEIDNLRAQEKSLNLRIEKIRNLDIDAQNNQLVIDKINLIVPTGQTEVVKFGERVIYSLAQNFIRNEGIKSGEEVVVSSDINNSASTNGNSSEVENSLSIRKIPSKFDINGSLEDIRKFFIQLYKGQDFFIVDSMSLKNVDDITWTGEVSLAKYQFSESRVFDPLKAYTAISENASLNQLVMTFIKTQFVDNQIENTNVQP